MVQKCINGGAFGKIFSCYEIGNEKKPLVVKFSSERKMLGKEIKALISMNKKGSVKVPKVIAYDAIILRNFEKSKSVLMGYYVMPKYAQSL